MNRITALRLAIDALNIGFDGEHIYKYYEAVQELEKMIKEIKK